MGLDSYRRKRDPARTPEPVPSGDPPRRGRGGRSFVVQEHHARALHWDVRLERDGVLVSWAVPKGLPLDPASNHLAQRTEDHPLDYATFEGDIPAGQYGGGRVTVWDTGTYELQTWADDEVKVVLHGRRVDGRYVFLRTGERWLVHRMDPSPAGWSPLPRDLAPMLAVPGRLPADGGPWSFEVKWDGVRALVAVQGGRLRITSRAGNDVTASYPELRGLGRQLGSRQVLLDGEIVTFGPDGRTDFGLLQNRMHVARPSAALQAATPVQLVVFDLLHLEGRSMLGESYDQRRAALTALQLTGAAWSVPAAFAGKGVQLLAATKAQGLEGIVAKRRDAPYTPGRRSDDWLKIKHVRRTSAVIAGWKPGAGGRAGRIGSLLLGVQGAAGLEYVGHVGTGFTAATLARLAELLAPLHRADSPFGTAVPRPEARDTVWVEPQLVAEVDYTEWTREGRLRHPSFKGLRADYDPKEVIRE